MSNRTHGLSKTPLYRTWQEMKRRCQNTKRLRYRDYGARGITVCDNWLTYFENFKRDMGEKPTPSHSLERINNSLGYSPSNCKWACPEEQASNTRANKMITYLGETYPLFIWEKKFQVKRNLFKNRLLKGWSVDRAFTQTARRSLCSHLRQTCF